MSNTTYASTTLKPTAAPAIGSLLRELFQASPLYIFATAAKTAFERSAQR
ncbi:MAG: hypothetical protein ABI702_18295 [Burkholderiales bacterium]